MNVHTPGPWNVLPWFAPSGAEITTVQALNRTVADCPGEDETTKANARLISAAPEMLAALEACVAAGAALQSGKRGGEVMGQVGLATDAARLAIARARGESHETPCD